MTAIEQLFGILVTFESRGIVVLPCLAVKKLLKSRKRYVQNIKVRQGLIISGFRI
jgi:hypothetical protein